MINRKIITSMLTIVMAFAVMTGGTMAYFTATADSANNTFATGTMAVSVDQSNGIQNTAITNNWQPGKDEVVRFDVVNTGSLPVNLKANVTGAWNDPNLLPTMVKATKVEYFNGTNWVTIVANDSGITGDVFYSPHGDNNALFTVNGGQRVPFRVTVVLDTTADNSYANHTFTAQLHVQAKQTNATAF